MPEKLVSRSAALSAIQVLVPSTVRIRRHIESLYAIDSGGNKILIGERLGLRVDLGAWDFYPEITRPYTFHELVQQVANGRDETNFGYVVGITEDSVRFKQNDITEERLLTDVEDVTWADGKFFGVEES
jgi:hypothetical protein